MKNDSTGSNPQTASASLVRWAVLTWMVGIAAFHIGSALAGRPIYRDIHLGTALEYAKGSINLLKPVVVGFNLNNTPTPQELPAWQAATALLFKVFGTWFGWANVVSMLVFFSCLYPLYRLAEDFGGSDTAWWTLLLFLAQPMVFIYAGEGSPDGLSISSAVWFMFFATKLWSEGSVIWLLLTIAAGMLAAVFKLPFFTAAGFGCCFMTLKEHWKRKAVIARFAVAAIMIGAGFYVWAKYMNYCYAQAELPFVDLRLSNSETSQWFFGDLKYRLSPGVWIKGAWRVFMAHFGSFALAALFLLSFLLKSPSRLARWWLLGGVLTTFIFFHVVLHHDYYYLMFAPAVAILSASVATHLESALSGLVPGKERCGLLIILFCLGLSTLQGIIGRNAILFFDSYPYAMSEIIKQHTSQTDKLLIQGGGWGGELLFLANRNGLSIWDTRLLEDRAVYDRLRRLGFNKLVMVSETPMLTAIRHTRDTSPVMKRESYQALMTPVVDSMPTIVETDDILIKDIP